MAQYFFDAVNEFHTVVDLHGYEITRKEEVRPAMLEAVRAIRAFVGDELASDAWSLEVRLGEDNRIAVVGFDEIEASGAEWSADDVSLAA